MSWRRLTAAAAVPAFVVLALLPAQHAAADFSFIYSGHAYQFVQENRTWLSATSAAKARSVGGSPGYLAQIDDAAENQNIFNRLLIGIPSAQFNNTRAPDGGNGAYVWIGAADRVTEGAWIWDGDGDGAGPQFWQGNNTGAAVGGLYNNWGRTGSVQNEPDNFNNLQDAAGISLDGWPLGVAGQWNDVNETNSLYYLIEFNAIPEPSIAGLTLVFLALRGVRKSTRPDRRRRCPMRPVQELRPGKAWVGPCRNSAPALRGR